MITNIELTGKEFNDQYKRRFLKVMYDDHIHYDFEYKLGLNIDTKPFNPFGECSEGGLYFCDKTTLHLFWQNYDTTIAIVTIPDDARVYVERNKFKSDKLVIIEFLNFADISDSFWLELLFDKKQSAALQYVENQTNDICVKAITQDASAIQFVRNQTEDLCMFAVQKNGMVIKYIRNPTTSISYHAVKQNSEALKYIKNQTHDICVEAVTSCFGLEFVLDQTEELCIISVMNFGCSLRLVKIQTNTICKLAVKENGRALKFVKNQTEKICRYAVKQNGYALQYVKVQTLEICRLAVKQNDLAIRYVNDCFVSDLGCVVKKSNSLQHIKLGSKTYKKAIKQPSDIIITRYERFRLGNNTL